MSCYTTYTGVRSSKRLTTAPDVAEVVATSCAIADGLWCDVCGVFFRLDGVANFLDFGVRAQNPCKGSWNWGTALLPNRSLKIIIPWLKFWRNSTAKSSKQRWAVMTWQSSCKIVTCSKCCKWCDTCRKNLDGVKRSCHTNLIFLKRI